MSGGEVATLIVLCILMLLCVVAGIRWALRRLGLNPRCELTGHVMKYTRIGEPVRYTGTTSIHIRTPVEMECRRCGATKRTMRTERVPR